MRPKPTPEDTTIAATDNLGLSRRAAIRNLGGGLIASAALGSVGLARPELVVAGTRRRRLSEFLDAQGSTATFLPAVPGIPPFRDFIGTFSYPPPGDIPVNFAYVDYAGVAAQDLADQGIHLGTKVRGSVTERKLKDGRAEVTVVLETTNALSWALKITDESVATAPLDFGYRPAELLANRSLRPVLGHCRYKTVFKNTKPGDPLPDVGATFAYPEVDPDPDSPLQAISYDIRAWADGVLRQDFDLDPDPARNDIIVAGTPVRLTVHDAGQGLDTDEPSFPFEIVELQPRRHHKGKHRH